MAEPDAVGDGHAVEPEPESTQADRLGIGPQRNGHVSNHRAQIDEQLLRRIECLEHIGAAPRCLERLADDPDTQASDTLSGGCRIRTGGRLGSDPLGVPPIRSGHDLEHQGVVGHRLGHRPDVIDGVIHVGQAVGGDEAMGGFHAYQPAPRRGDADTASFVGPEGHVDEAGGHGGAGAGRGSAGGEGRVDRVPGGTVGRALAQTEGQVLQVRLPGDGGSGIEQALDHDGVLGGHHGGRPPTSIGRGDAGHGDAVLHPDRLAGQGTVLGATHLAEADEGVIGVLTGPGRASRITIGMA